MGIGRRVVGEGPSDARIMVIGESANRDDARTGRPFSPKKNRENEIDRFLDGVRLPVREELYLTYWIKEWCGDEAENTQADFDRDEEFLGAEIRRVQPDTIVALGRAVTRRFLGDVDLDEVASIPWQRDGCVVFPIYSPAAAFRSPELSSQVAYGFAQLEAFLAGQLQARTLYNDQYPEPVYEEITDLDTLDTVMSAGGRFAADTEGWPWAPWSVQISNRPGHAYVIRSSTKADSVRLLHGPRGDMGADVGRAVTLTARFAEWVNAVPELYTFTFHSALHDLSMFRAFGIDVRRITFDDTAIMSFNLQLEPPGLKPLCVRHCGMQMDSYDSIMGDTGTRLATDWLMSCLENEEYDHEEKCQAEFVRLTTTPYVDKKGKTKPGRKIRSLPKLPKSHLHKAIERCLRSQSPRKLWGDQVLDRHVEAGAKFGGMWEATLDHVQLSDAIRYAGRDADGTRRLAPILQQCLVANDLTRTYAADLGTVALIDRMQQVGIRPDLGHFAALSTDLATELVDIQSRLAGALVRAGAFDIASAEKFNANSTFQVGPLLFDFFGVTSLKTTPGGDDSTNDKILEAIEKDPKTPVQARELIGIIKSYRETYKLKSTFVDAIPALVDRWPHDGRIHATFRITRVVSGRLAASDPNLLAMPKYGKFATRFREGFTSGDGRVFGSWDLSQIELRVLAHLSQDPVLLAAFRDGLDLHARLAQRIFGGAEADHKKGPTRLAAKGINFGLPMGMTEVGLAIELQKNGVKIGGSVPTEDDAKRWLDETMALYAYVPNYQQNKIAEARRNGFVTDLCGRRRYVGGIRSNDPGTRAEAERFAFSTPIQSGAQQVMKRAEAHIWNDIIIPMQDEGKWIEPLIQIHDDMILEFDQRLVTDVDERMVFAMTQTFEGLSVPIETSGDFGINWGVMHDIRAHQGDVSFAHVDGCETCQSIAKKKAA